MNKNKVVKIFSVCLMIIVILSYIVPSLADSIVKVYLNDTMIEFDVNPIVVNGRTLVPIRAIFEKLGADVDWDNDTNTATAKKGNKKVLIKIDSEKMYVNDEVKVLDVPAMLYNSRTLVPLRAVSEAFDCEVMWNEESNTVNIYNTDLEETEKTLFLEFVSLGLECQATATECLVDYINQNFNPEYKKLFVENISLGYDAINEAYHISLSNKEIGEMSVELKKLLDIYTNILEDKYPLSEITGALEEIQKSYELLYKAF